MNKTLKIMEYPPFKKPRIFDSQNMMETFIVTFPHIAEDIFCCLDDETLKKSYKVCQSWKKFLENQRFFWTRLTKGHPGWSEVMNQMNLKTISILGESFFALQADLENTHPIFCAIRSDKVQIFKSLTKLYPNFRNLTFKTFYHFSRRHISLMHYAAKEGKSKMVKFFIDNFALEDRNPQDNFGWTPLHIASRFGHFKVFKLLFKNIEGEKNPEDYQGWTPLHCASKYGHFRIFKLLFNNIEGEKNPNDHRGWTPLHLASESGHFEIVKYLTSVIEDRGLNLSLDQCPVSYRVQRKKHEEKFFYYTSCMIFIIFVAIVLSLFNII